MVAVPFVKMAGAGNDFIIIRAHKGLDYCRFTKAVCDRHNGIGADGVLIWDESEKSDYRMRIINADGSEAEMCGNGARCMAVYIAGNLKPLKPFFSMETIAGEILAESQAKTARIKLSNPKDYRPGLALTVGGKKFEAHYIDTGVPHTIVFVDRLQEVDVQNLGRLIRHHPEFALRGTNVDFVESRAGDIAAVRTYERGVEAETMACGTGAVASALVAFLHAHPDVKRQKNAMMKVLTAGGGVLEVSFDLDSGFKMDNVWLKGETKLIAKGEYFYV